MASDDLSVDRLCISDECNSGSFRGPENKLPMKRRPFRYREPGQKRYLVTMVDEEVFDTDESALLKYEEIVDETFGRGKVRLWDCVKNRFICILTEAERQMLEGRKEVKKVAPPFDARIVTYKMPRNFHLEVEREGPPLMFKPLDFPPTME